MGYFLIVTYLALAAYGWRARPRERRFLARLCLVMAAVIAVQMWWGL